MKHYLPVNPQKLHLLGHLVSEIKTNLNIYNVKLFLIKWRIAAARALFRHSQAKQLDISISGKKD